MSDTTGPAIVEDEQDGAETRELELDKLDTPETDDEGNLTDPTHVSGNPDFVPQHVLDGGYDYRVPGNDASGYIGVDPSYQTYANPLNKPMLTDGERFQFTDQLDHLIDNADERGYLRDPKTAKEAQDKADAIKADADALKAEADEAQAVADKLKEKEASSGEAVVEETSAEQSKVADEPVVEEVPVEEAPADETDSLL